MAYPASVNAWRVKQAARVIRGGGVIAYPTEAVFGLGCDPYNHSAVMRILALKQRPMAKGLILIAAEFGQFAPFVLPLEDAARDRLADTWPGPVTWLLPARPDTPIWLRGEHATIAVRVTAHPLAAALCRSTGHALVSTSANPGGRPPARHSWQVRRYFREGVDMVLNGALGGEARPSEIRDLRSGAIVRSG